MQFLIKLLRPLTYNSDLVADHKVLTSETFRSSERSVIIIWKQAGAYRNVPLNSVVTDFVKLGALTVPWCKHSLKLSPVQCSWSLCVVKVESQMNGSPFSLASLSALSVSPVQEVGSSHQSSCPSVWLSVKLPHIHTHAGSATCASLF